jgi:iron complex outermembrane receptor protein
MQIQRLSAGLIALGILFVGATQLFAVEEDLMGKSLEDLLKMPVTSVSGREENKNEVASAMTVITKEEIQRSGARNIPDLFYRVPGMQVRKIDGHRYYVSIRSAGSLFQGNILVLIDNVIVLNPNENGTNWELLPVTLNEIERIEIIRGPGGVLYSSNAVNGVINIITKKATVRDNYVAAQGGSTIRFEEELGAGATIDKFSIREYGGENYDAGFTHKKNDTRVHDKTHSGIVGLKGEYDWSKDTNLVLDGKLLDENAINDGANANGASIKRPGFQGTVSAQFNQKINDHYDYNLHFDYMSMSPTDTTSYDSTSNSYTLNTQHNFRYHLLGNHVTSLGMEARWIHISKTPGFEPPADPYQTQEVTSAFFQEEYRPWEKLILTAGARFTHNTNVSTVTGLLYEPRASVVYLLNDQNSLRAVITRAIKTPSMTDRDLAYTVFPGGMLRGSQTLDPEKDLTYELGWQGLFGKKLNLNTSIFYTESKDPIMLSSTFLPGPGVLYEPTVNNGSLRSIGVEWDAKYKITDDLSANADYAYINAQPRPNFEEGGGYERHQSLDLSKNVVGGGFSYTKNDLTVDTYEKWICGYTDTMDTQIVGNTMKFPSYWKTTLRVAYAFRMPGTRMKNKDVEVEFVANDLIGAHVVESPHGYVREPDIYGGLKIKF